LKPGRIHVGVGGWIFPEWRDNFYPKGLVQARELEYLAARLTATEINATFYRLQKPASFAKWRDAVPDHFRFALKGSSYCTNRRNLAEVGPALANFVEQGLVELGDKLGPINWQLRDTKRFDADEMKAFLAMLPRQHEGVALRHAIEARHESFSDPAFRAIANEAGVAVVVTGAPRFDAFFDMRPAITRTALCHAIGIDASLPIVTYLCSSRFVAAQEQEFVQRWLAELRQSSDPVLAGCRDVTRRK